MPPRRYRDSAGNDWTVELISHGNTSGYLNRKVHRPILQFSPARRGPTRYLGLPEGVATLEELDDERLGQLLERAAVH